MCLFLCLNPNESLEHPESSVAEQKKFIKHLNALCDLVKEGTVVNPFNETGSELITLDTGEVMDPAIVVCLKNAPTIGENMFTEFVTDRIEEASKPLSDVIKKKPVHILKQTKDKPLSISDHGLPAGYPNLYAVVFENLMPIHNTMPNCKNVSPSAQFA